MTEDQYTSTYELARRQLNDIQTTAADWQEGPLLLLAGPGSGKTRVLTVRIARILNESASKRFRILALTFTTKAADEMRDRLAALTPHAESRAFVGTFHSFAGEVLRNHGTHVDVPSDFRLLSRDEDRRALLLEAIKSDRSSGLSSDDASLISVIDRLKSRLVPPQGCARRFKDSRYGARVEKIYALYEKALKVDNSLDFSSLIFLSRKLFHDFPTLAAQYSSTYRYWFVDEFQDTTGAQYALIRDMAARNFKNIFAVADDDQIIYQWNGASYKFFEVFNNDFSPTTIFLPTNYRCPPDVVHCANLLIRHNKLRTPNKPPLMAAKLESEKTIRLRKYQTDAEEFEAVAASIKELPSQAGVVVLARNRHLLEGVKQSLIMLGIKAAIAQRRDDFVTPQIVWLQSSLRLLSRRQDQRALELLTIAYNRIAGVNVELVDVINQADTTQTDYLTSWMAYVSASDLSAVGRDLLSKLEEASTRPGRYREYSTAVVTIFRRQIGDAPTAETIDNDFVEDLSAWTEIEKSIRQQIGANAPLDHFLQELASRSKEPPINDDTVPLMTIHGSKGKEFNTVYLIGMAEDVLPSYQAIRSSAPEDLEEERRNCFVAITRTQGTLNLSYAEKYRSFTKTPSRFLKEMGFEAL